MKFLEKLNRSIKTDSEDMFSEYHDGYHQMANGAIAGASIAVGALTASALHRGLSTRIGSVPSAIVCSVIGGAIGGLTHHACKCTADALEDAIYEAKEGCMDDFPDDIHIFIDDEDYDDIVRSLKKDEEDDEAVVPDSEIPEEEASEDATIEPTAEEEVKEATEEIPSEDDPGVTDEELVEMLTGEDKEEM